MVSFETFSRNDLDQSSSLVFDIVFVLLGANNLSESIKYEGNTNSTKRASQENLNQLSQEVPQENLNRLSHSSLVH